MKRKHWLIIGGVVIGIGLIWLATAGSRSALPVGAVEARQGPIREFVDERGITRLPQTHRITMPYAGRIEAITLEEGMPVKQGQTVGQIVQLDRELDVKEAAAVVERLTAAIDRNAYTEVEKTALNQAKQFVQSMRTTVEAAAARRESGKANYDYAEKHLGRTQRLFETKAQSLDELDRALLHKVEAEVDYQQDKLVYASMQSLAAATDLLPTMVEQYIFQKGLSGAVLEKERAEAAARLRQVEEDERRGKMTSPVDGVVLSRHGSNERFLSAGTELLEIGRLEDLEVEADVLSLDVVNAKQGDPVEIYGPAIGLPRARGKVSRIYPAGFTKVSSLGVEQQRVKIVVRFEPEDLQRLLKQGLGVGYRVRVQITTAQKDKALVIPRSAIFRGGDGDWRIYAVRDGYTGIEKVKIGMINDEQAEVIAGLSPGDLVIRAPESNLVDGRRVEVLEKAGE